VRPERDLPRAAANAVADGASSASHIELASLVGLPDGERTDALDALAQQALVDLGAAELTRNRAAEVLVRRYASAITKGEIAAIDGAVQIVQVIVEMDWDGQGRPLWDAGTGDMYLLADEILGRSQRPSDARVRQIETSIASAAERLVASIAAEK
jgi:hypothetical protein